MEIKLPRMPFKFTTPDGLMEVTVRSGSRQGSPEMSDVYAAAATFIDHGPKALTRIPITKDAKTHGEVMKTLLTGFPIDPSTFDPTTLEHRVLEALCSAQGVEILDN